MNVSNWNLDELVAEVMADLRAANVVVDASPSDVSRALSRDFQTVRPYARHDGTSSSATSSSDVFYVEERTIVVETALKLAARATSKRWSVAKNAVITPAARDELKKLGVELVVRPNFAVDKSSVNSRQSLIATSSAEDRAPNRPTVLAITHAPNGESPVTAVADYLTRNAAVDERRFECLKETSRVISEEIANVQDLKVVVMTADLAIALIWANRYKGVRAIGAFSFEQAKRDVDATNANVLVLNARELGSYQARRVVDYFIRSKRKQG